MTRGFSGMWISRRTSPIACRIWRRSRSRRSSGRISRRRIAWCDLVKELGGNEHAQRAALLAKRDLTTEMVKEFTDLQGIVGGLYARAQGEPEAVCEGDLRALQAAQHGRFDSRTREGRSWRWRTSSTRCANVSGSGWCRRVRKIRSRCAARRRAWSRFWWKAKLDHTTFDALFDGELREFHARARQVLFPRNSRLQVRRSQRGAGVGRGTLADVEARLTALARVRPTEDFEPLAASFKRIQQHSEAGGLRSRSDVLDEELAQAGPETRSVSARSMRVRA